MFTLAGFDLGQDLVSIFSGHVQIEQDEVGPGSVGIYSILVQEGQTFNAVGGGVKVDVRPGLFEGLPREVDVVGIVFDEKDLDGPADGRAHKGL